MEKQEPRKFFNVSKLLDGIGEDAMIWSVVQNALERNGIDPKSGIEGLSIRYYDDNNSQLENLGDTDETV
tara:strand:+ start:438 stop:647 length:210 start_codon:yes stop_codon:yes gene_type:complete